MLVFHSTYQEISPERCSSISDYLSPDSQDSGYVWPQSLCFITVLLFIFVFMWKSLVQLRPASTFWFLFPSFLNAGITRVSYHTQIESVLYATPLHAKLLCLEVLLHLGQKYPVSLLFGWDFESLLSICPFSATWLYLLEILAEMWCLSWTQQVSVRQPFWCHPAYGAVPPASFGPQASILLHGWQYLG